MKICGMSYLHNMDLRILYTVNKMLFESPMTD